MGTVTTIQRSQRTALRLRIKRLRDRTGLNQREFGKLVGVSPALVGAWESGRVDTILDVNKRKIQKAVGLTDAEMFDLFYRGDTGKAITSIPADIERRLSDLLAAGVNPADLWAAVRGVLAVIPVRRLAA